MRGRGRGRLFGRLGRMNRTLGGLPRRQRTRFLRLDVPEDSAQLTRDVFGFVSPPLTLVYVTINILMIVIFRIGRFNSPTHMVLMAIAISDTVYGLSILVPYMHFYTLGNDKDFVPFGWCWPHFFLTAVIPRIAHTTSLNFTVLLALHRYVSVKFPFKAKMICSKRNTIISIICMPFVSLLPYILFIYDHSTLYGQNVQSLIYPNQTIYACAIGRYRLGGQAVLWTENVLSRIVPITCLLLLDIMLIVELYRTTAHMQQRYKSSKPSASRRQQNRRITLLTTMVVVSVLVTEVPGLIAQLTILYAERATTCKACAMKIYTVIFHLSISLLYPSNFLIYCFISAKFRKIFKSIVMFLTVSICPCCFTGQKGEISNVTSTVPSSSEDNAEEETKRKHDLGNEQSDTKSTLV